MMQVIYHNPRFSIEDPRQHFKERGWCDVLVYGNHNRLADETNVVIVTEPINSDGSDRQNGLSITNGIELIATGLYRLGFNWEYFVEHYPERSVNRISRTTGGRYYDPLFSENFALVNFEKFHPNAPVIFGNPVWDHIERSALDDLVGTKFPEWHGDIYEDVPRWPPATKPW